MSEGKHPRFYERVKIVRLMADLLARKNRFMRPHCGERVMNYLYSFFMSVDPHHNHHLVLLHLLLLLSLIAPLLLLLLLRPLILLSPFPPFFAPLFLILMKIKLLRTLLARISFVSTRASVPSASPSYPYIHFSLLAA